MGTFEKYPLIRPAHTQQVSGGHFYKVPSTIPGGYFLNELTLFFHKVFTMYPEGILWKNPLSSFTMCPSIRSKCAQRVLCNVPTTRSQCGLILPQTLKELSKSPVGIFWSNWWAHCERTQRVLSQNTPWVLCRHFTKERRGFVQKIPTGFCAGYFLKVPTTYLPGMSWANWWALFENDQYLPAGYFVG